LPLLRCLRLCLSGSLSGGLSASRSLSLSLSGPGARSNPELYEEISEAYSVMTGHDLHADEGEGEGEDFDEDDEGDDWGSEGEGEGAAGKDDGKERREDPDDGGLYTREEFVELYGGTAEWDEAGI